jgi:hypothetical protein
MDRETSTYESESIRSIDHLFALIYRYDRKACIAIAAGVLALCIFYFPNRGLIAGSIPSTYRWFFSGVNVPCAIALTAPLLLILAGLFYFLKSLHADGLPAIKAKPTASPDPLLPADRIQGYRLLCENKARHFHRGMLFSFLGFSLLILGMAFVRLLFIIISRG